MPVAFEFHISKAARTHYEFDRALFQTTGNVILPDFPAARAFARLMNERADRERYPDRVVHAAELNAMGLIDEILHHAIEIYRRTVNPQVMAEALAALEGDLGRGSPEPGSAPASSSSSRRWPSSAAVASRRPTWPARARAWPTARSCSKSC